MHKLQAFCVDSVVYWIFASPSKFFDVDSLSDFMKEQQDSKNINDLVSLFTGRIEIDSNFKSRSNINHVVFDFDGTISLIREGWPDVMLPMFEELLPNVQGDISESVRKMLLDDIMTLNGKQTIYQMIRFCERIKERGGNPEDPIYYKREYLRRLDAKINGRVEALANGEELPEKFLLHGIVNLLDQFQHRGLNLYLASGTDEQYVKREAELLGVSKYFGDHIYGALDDYKSFSKKIIIERILENNSVSGGSLLVIGDGYVEIENGKSVGGVAIGVASDEANNGSGEFDEWKRQRLIGVGADIVIADYRDSSLLLELILGK